MLFQPLGQILVPVATCGNFAIRQGIERTLFPEFDLLSNTFVRSVSLNLFCRAASLEIEFNGSLLHNLRQLGQANEHSRHVHMESDGSELTTSDPFLAGY